MGKSLIGGDQDTAFAEGMAGDQQVQRRQRLAMAFQFSAQPRP
jgi:hypothetical protein